MIRDVNLIEQLPLFVQEFKEMEAALNAENPEFQLVINESEKVKNNQFVESSDINGIKRFEKLLNIRPLIDDTLESRISRIMSRWNDVVPYTYVSLIEKLDLLCGANNYIMIPTFNDYELQIIVYLPLSGQVDELEHLISYIIPVNIDVTASNQLDFQASGTIYLASTNIKLNRFEINSELNSKFSAEGSFKNGSTLIKVLEYTIN